MMVHFDPRPGLQTKHLPDDLLQAITGSSHINDAVSKNRLGFLFQTYLIQELLHHRIATETCFGYLSRDNAHTIQDIV